MADQSKYSSKLQSARVLVIGGSSGVGYAVAEAAVEYGATVFIASSSLDRVQQSVSTLKSSYPSVANRIFGYQCNLAEEMSVEENIANLLRTVGQLDHIVFTAGDSVPPSNITDATIEKMKAAAAVRYTAPVFLAKHALVSLRLSADCSITLTTGVIVERPIPNWSLIAGPRVAVVGLAKNLALDMRPIRVNVVELGAVETGTWNHLPQDERENLKAQMVKRMTTGRIAQSTDVAEAYLYCMRDGNVSGSIIASNGGALIM